MKMMKKMFNKHLPRCIKCKYSEKTFLKSDYKSHLICMLSKEKEQDSCIQSVFIPSLKTYEYIRPEWCPLKGEN